MTDLEKKKFKAELLRVQSAKAEMEYVIAQRMEEIERLTMNVQKQEEAEKLLLDKIEGK